MLTCLDRAQRTAFAITFHRRTARQGVVNTGSSAYSRADELGQQRLDSTVDLVTDGADIDHKGDDHQDS